MQYPESSQRTRIEGEVDEFRSSTTPTLVETAHHAGHKEVDTRKRETPKPKPKVSSFLATVLLDWPPPEKPPSSPTSPGPPSPCRISEDSYAGRTKGNNYELVNSSRSGCDSYRAPSFSTDVQWGSPISTSSDPGMFSLPSMGRTEDRLTSARN